MIGIGIGTEKEIGIEIEIEIGIEIGIGIANDLEKRIVGVEPPIGRAKILPIGIVNAGIKIATGQEVQMVD